MRPVNDTTAIGAETVSPNSMNPRARSYRRRAAPLIFLIGVPGIVFGAVGLIDPSTLTTSSAAQKLDGPIDEMWLIMYLLGGLLLTIGGLGRRPGIETVGCWILAAACLINAAAILVNRGPIGGGVTAFPLLLAVLVLFWRIQDHLDAANTERRHVHLPRLGNPHDRRFAK